MTVRIGTRGSRLALAQTALVADALRAQGVAAEIVVVHTRGETARRTCRLRRSGAGHSRTFFRT